MPSPRRLAVAAGLLAAGLSACGSAPADPTAGKARPVSARAGSATAPATRAAGSGGSARSGSGARPPATTATTSTTVPPTTTTTLPKPQPGWTVVAEGGGRIVTDERTVVEPDGDRVTLVRWHAGTYRADLHFGSEDPPSSGLAVPAVAGDAVAAAERPALLGAFNGGFQVSTHSGGFEADGLVAVPLVTGAASAVVDARGVVHIGAWRQGVPVPGEHVVSVRQNLQLLIDHGVVSPEVGNISAWGATLGGGSLVARSALGTDPAGDLVYAGSMDALPGDLASALRSAGVTEAMQLDINPYWVQADTATRPGGPLSAAVPGQQRPTDQYLAGWTRDFFTVLSRRACRRTPGCP